MTGDGVALHCGAMKPLGSVRCPLLIGRDDLLELVDRRLDDVAAGHGQFLLLAGEAGIGKTRFLGAIGQKAESAGFTAIGGAVAPQDHDVPAASILDMARTMAAHARVRDAGRTTCSSSADGRLEAEHVQRRRLVMEIVELILAVAAGPDDARRSRTSSGPTT